MRAGDRLLLATDGVFGFVDETSLADVLRNTPAAQSAAVACMERAVARGSNDNLTAVVVVVDQPSHDQGPVIEDEDQDDSTLLY
jgi:serine/threonine protein phosphatase PrpC